MSIFKTIFHDAPTAYRELKAQLKAIEAMSAAEAIDEANRNNIAIPAAKPGTPEFQVWRKCIVQAIKAVSLNDQKLAKKAAHAANFCAQPPDIQNEVIGKFTRVAAETLESAKNTSPPTYVKPFVERFRIAKLATISGDPMIVRWAISELGAIIDELTQIKSTKHE